MSDDRIEMPFVLIESNGGPFDDAAFAAGWECGALDSTIRDMNPRTIAATVHVACLAQRDLIAMRYGYHLTHQEVMDSQPAMWAHVEFVKDTDQ